MTDCTRETLGRTWTYLALDSRVLCVAVKGDIEDWSAYIGPCRGQDHVEEAQEVYRRGTKIPRWMAERLFPSMAKAYSWRA